MRRRLGGLACLVGFVLSVLPAAASFAVEVGESSMSLQQQIEQIDQEIVLLRAELAMQHADLEALRRYVKELEQMTLNPGFAARLEGLKAFLAAPPEREPSVETPEWLPAFQWPNADSQVVILLPLSGKYEMAGQSLWEGLQAHWPFNKPPVVLDSALYDNAFELWEWVKLYSPDFIIGPLDKARIQAWQALRTGVPILYLNTLDSYLSNEKGLAPNREEGLTQLRAFVEASQYRQLLVLHAQEPGAQKLADSWQQHMAGAYSLDNWVTQAVDASVHQSVQQALNVASSIARKHWVQRTIDTDVEFVPRARQDIEAVIHFLPMQQAVQVKPLLKFYRLNRVASLWYPSQEPQSNDLLALLPSWQQTYGFLAPYLTTVAENEPSEEGPDLKTGLFYALGGLAAESLRNPQLLQPNQWVANTRLGVLVTGQHAEWRLLPNVFWLDEKQIVPVVEYQDVHPLN